MLNKVKIIAHCGYSAKYPENTLIAFREALRVGADAIEFDIHETVDSYLVIHHDYYIKLPIKGTRLIKNLRFKDLKNTLNKILTLDEILSEFGKKISFEVELKTPSVSFLEKVLKKFINARLLNWTEFTSPHIPLLIYLKNCYPRVKTGLFLEAYPRWMTDELGREIVCSYMKLTRSNVAHLPLSIVDKKIIKMLKKNNKLIHVANCNDKNSFKTLRNFTGIDQISTTDPIMARQHLALDDVNK